MDFIKRRLSMNADPDKDQEEKAPSGTLLESLSTRRATLWNDFTSKIKSDKSSTDASYTELSTNSTPKSSNGKSFMESVKERLQGVKLYENGDTDSDEENDRLRGEPECAPLIDTGDNSIADGDSDKATCGESDAGEPSAQVTINGASGTDPASNVNRKRLGKRQDSFTAEEVYLETVAAPVRVGVIPPDSQTALVSPSKAVQEFAFTKKDEKLKSQTKKKVKNSLQVANGNLINFDSIHNLSKAAAVGAETVVHHEDDGILDYESSGDESSEPVYTEFASRRSNSLDSIKSIESCYEDEDSKQLKLFADQFVDNIFSEDCPNSTEDKARFGECVRDGNFRLNFAKAISVKRANRKAVTEHTFYQLVQYFAVVLFECGEADDYTPATILMNMCFTFYYEDLHAGNIQKNFLSTSLKSQPIWQSMRYWNAAFYESVQNERLRKPLTTNNSQGGSNYTTSPVSDHSKSDISKDNAADEDQDRIFQENIIFGQLGTFLFNMRAFGLNMEWCLEFLRKQSTIGNLNEEHIQMLRENVEAVKMDK